MGSSGHLPHFELKQLSFCVFEIVQAAQSQPRRSFASGECCKHCWYCHHQDTYAEGKDYSAGPRCRYLSFGALQERLPGSLIGSLPLPEQDISSEI